MLQEPQPMTPWEGVRSANATTSCFGFVSLAPKSAPDMVRPYGQEDCLHVSVYTNSLGMSAKRPVIVYFHGGGFGCRTALGFYSKANYFMDYDVVLVQVNYRLAMFGFLDFGDGVLPKNVGLKDQLMALKWVKNNIQFFGGDPDQVTVMGESAGAASAHHLAISPATEGLLQRAILISGNGYGRWAWADLEESKFVADHVAEFANCKRSTTVEVVDCLRDVDGETLIAIFPKIENLLQTPDYPSIPFKPTIASVDSSEPFLRGFPKNWPPIKIPIVTSFDSGEAIFLCTAMMPEFMGKEYDFSERNKRLDEFLLQSLVTNDNLTPEKKKILEFVKKRYLGGKSYLTPKDVDGLIRMYSDTLFVAPLYELIKKTEGDMNLYYNDFQGVFSAAPNFGKLNKTSHCTQLFHLFDYGMIPQLPAVDMVFSKELLQALVDFASGKKPLKWGSTDWPVSRKGETLFLSLHSSGHKIVDMKGLKTTYEAWKEAGPRRLAYD